MKKPKSLTKPKKSDHIPATKKMLNLTKQELKSEIISLSLEMRAQFKGVDGKFKGIDGHFKGIDGQFKGIDGQFKNMDGRFDQMDAKIESLIAAVHKTNAIVEEQNSRNIFVLDGYTSIYDSQGAIKARVENLEKTVFGKRQA